MNSTTNNNMKGQYKKRMVVLAESNTKRIAELAERCSQSRAIDGNGNYTTSEKCILYDYIERDIKQSTLLDTIDKLTSSNSYLKNCLKNNCVQNALKIFLDDTSPSKDIIEPHMALSSKILNSVVPSDLVQEMARFNTNIEDFIPPQSERQEWLKIFDTFSKALPENGGAAHDCLESFVCSLENIEHSLPKEKERRRFLKVMEDVAQKFSRLAEGSENILKTSESVVGNLGDKFSKLMDAGEGFNLTDAISLIPLGLIGFGVYYTSKSDDLQDLVLGIVLIALGIYFGGFELLKRFMSKLGLSVANLFDSFIDKFVSPDRIEPHGVFGIAGDEIIDSIATVWMGSIGLSAICSSDRKKIISDINGIMRIKDGIPKMILSLQKVVEKVYNYIFASKLGFDPLTISSTNNPAIDEFEKECNNIFNQSARGTFILSERNLVKLTALVETGEKLYKNAQFLRQETGALKILLDVINKLKKIKTHFEAANIHLTGFRQEPIGILLRGAPGVFKSMTCQHLSYICSVMHLEPERFEEFMENPNVFIYNRQCEADYWSGYTPDKIVVTYDDIGQNRKAQESADNEYMNIIRGNNSFEYNLHMAEMEQKGVTMYRSLFSICTSNMWRLRNDCLESLEALERRFDFNIIVTPKEQYCKNPTSNLFNQKFDISKIPVGKDGKTPNPTPELQDFHICKSNGQPTGIKYSFDELVMKIRDRYLEKKKWHVQHLENFRSTVKTYSDKFKMDVPTKALDTKKAPSESSDTVVEAQSNMDSMNTIPMVSMEDIPAIDSSNDPEVISSSSSYHSASKETTHWDLGEMYAKYAARDNIHDYDPLESIKAWWKMRMSPDMYADYLKLLNMPYDVLKETSAEILKYANYSIHFSHYFPEHIIGTCFYKRPGDVIGYMLHNRPMAGIYTLNLENIELLSPSFGNLDTEGKIGSLFRHPIVTKLKAYGVYIFNKVNEFWWLPFIFIALKKVYTKFLKIQENPSIPKEYNDLNTHKLLDILKMKINKSINEGSYENLKKDLDEYFSVVQEQMNYDHSRRPHNSKKVHSLSKLKNNIKPHFNDKTGYDISHKITSKNTYKMVFENPDGLSIDLGHVTFIRGCYALIPLHYVAIWARLIEEEEGFGDKTLELVDNFGMVKSKQKIGDVIMRTFGENLGSADMCLACFPDIAPRPDIVKNFVSESDMCYLQNNSCVTITIPRKGTTETFTSQCSFQKVPINVQSEALDYEVVKCVRYIAMTQKGDCGLPVILQNRQLGGKRLLGLHIAGSSLTRAAYASVVTQEDLLVALSEMDESLEQFNVQEIESQFSEMGITPQSDMEFFKTRDSIKTRFNILGKANLPHTSSDVTDILESHIHNHLEDNGEPILSTQKPAALRPDKSIDPYDKALAKYCISEPKMDLEILHKAVADYEMFLYEVSKVQVAPRILLVEEALWGIEGNDSFRSMNSGSSPGYPLKVIDPNFKKEIFGPNAIRDKTNPSFREIAHTCSRIAKDAANNIRHLWIFTDNKKNERRPIEKVEKKETRLFSGCPFYYFVLVRQYFGAFAMWMLDNKIHNESALGIDVHSPDWDQLAQRLGSFSAKTELAKVLAGDYSKYDGSELPTIHWLILNIINRWYNDSSRNQRIRRILWLEVVNSRHIFREVVYEWTASLPSGHPLTTIINTMYNSISFRYCFFRTPTLEMKKFSDYVKLEVLGDDNVAGLHPIIEDIFNQETIPPLMKELGLTYTDEAKSGKVHKYRFLTEIEFLKRKFRFEPLLGRFVPPLRLSVILEIPQWSKKGDKYNIIAADNMSEAASELAYYDDEMYNKYIHIIDRARRKFASHLIVEPAIVESRLVKLGRRKTGGSVLGTIC